MSIEIAKLSAPIRTASDMTATWAVYGPGAEFQLFLTKKNAMLYAKIRRASGTMIEASRAYARS